VNDRIAFVLSTYPGEEQSRREDVILRHARPGLDLGIIRVDMRTYDGLTPDRQERLVPLFLDAFEAARDDGYHAAVPFGMYDLGADGGKAIMPVVGPCEAALHAATLVGRRIGMICYTAELMPSLRRLVRTYAMDHFVVAFQALGIPLTELSQSAESMRDQLASIVRSMIDEHGVDVLVVMGVTMCPVLVSREELEAEVGIPVVDGISAPIEMAVALRRLGLRPSEVQWPRG
jgi:allantoin racemase